MTLYEYDPGACFGCPPGSGCSTPTPTCSVCYSPKYYCDICGREVDTAELTTEDVDYCPDCYKEREEDGEL